MLQMVPAADAVSVPFIAQHLDDSGAFRVPGWRGAPVGRWSTPRWP
jgi:hypothetical protein